jgi:2-desacetyl-2-hydroxyethyl bacteriochlorophyllide A dehydrogenase
MNVRQIVFEDINKVVVRTADEPLQPGPGEVVLASAYLGICGSDLHVLQGKHPWTKPPVITGHELAAVVEKIGPEVSNVVPGDHVALNPLFSCGTCRRCRMGSFNTCDAGRVTGYVPPRQGVRGVPGVGQTKLVMSARQLHRLPQDMPLDKACLAEPLAVGVHASSLFDDLEDVLVIGGGPIGLCVLLGLQARGAGRVTVVEPIAYKRELAKRLGAAEALSPEEAQLAPRYTACFDCVGGQQTFDLASGSALSGGCVIVVGISPGPLSVPMPRMQRFEIRIQGSGLYLGKDIDRAIELIASGKANVTPLISMVRPLDEAREAYAAAQAPGSVKVLVQMS